MRILITTPVFPPDLGGPAVYVPNIANFLIDRGHEVKVVAFCEDPNPKGYRFPVVAITRVALPLRYLKSFFAILREARDVDLVYVQEHLALLAVAAAKLRGKKCVVRVMVDGSWEIAHRYGWTNDDIDAFQKKNYGWKVALTRFLQRRWWNWVDAIVPVSDYLRGIVAGHGIDPRKLHLIHNVYNGPKDFSLTRAQCRAELGLAAEAKIVVTVCRLMVWKGVDGLIRSLARLKNANGTDAPLDLQLVVVGDGDQLENWTKLAAEEGVSDRVRFVGNRPHAETLKWIKAADAFALNSRYEGLSHTLLEVMFLGTPIVCSNVCGNPELVEDGVNGLLAGFNDVPAISKQLSKLFTDRDASDLYARRSQEKVRFFERDAMYGKVIALFERLTNTASTASREPIAR